MSRAAGLGRSSIRPPAVGHGVEVSPAPGFTTAGRRRRTVRRLAVVSGLSLLVAALWWATVLLGEIRYGVAEALRVMAGQTVPGASFVVGELRLPRALVGLLTGLAFGMAGTTSQTMLRNQLASPDIIGITSGASASAVFAILVLGWSGTPVTVLAVLAGVATAAVIYLLSGSGKAQGGHLILIGIGVSSMFSSIVAYLQMRASVYDVADAMRWLSGSLGSAAWEQVPLLAVTLIVLGGLLALAGRGLGPMVLGEEAATGLGVHVPRTRAVLVLAMVGLSAVATAATGPIAFVSFLAGPVAGRLVGPTDRTLLVPAGLMGAAIVLGADLLAQQVLPTALPVGVVTGIVGAPALLVQLLRINRQGASA